MLLDIFIVSYTENVDCFETSYNILGGKFLEKQTCLQ